MVAVFRRITKVPGEAGVYIYPNQIVCVTAFSSLKKFSIKMCIFALFMNLLNFSDSLVRQCVRHHSHFLCSIH